MNDVDASGLINGVIASKVGEMLVMYTKGGLVVVVGSEAASRSVLYPPQGEEEEENDQIIRFG